MPVVRYFAAAEDAAGRAEESRAETRVGELRAALAADYPALRGILPKCSLLVAGLRAGSDDIALSADVLVDVLPPFAGG
jgi:molybdopterin converting factor small subunit